MTTPMIILLVILFVALILFSIETLPAEVIALGVLILLIITNILTPEQAFAGFSSDTSIMILGILLLTTALVKTGAVQLITQRILLSAGNNGKRLYWLITLTASAMSTFISNTAAAAFYVPVVLGISKRIRMNPSKMLMPLAFATILASSVTLVSTSTNLVVSGLLQDHHMPPLGMFELTPVGLPILALGLIYMFFIGQKLIPVRSQESSDNLQANILPYCTEVEVPQQSAWVNKSLDDLQLGPKYDLTVVRILRGGSTIVIPRGNTVVKEDDHLLLEGSREGILTLNKRQDVVFTGEVAVETVSNITTQLRLAEVILMPGSRFVGRTLAGLNFRKKYGLQVLGINRKGHTLTKRIPHIRLRVGDQLLIQGDQDTLVSLSSDENFRILTASVETPGEIRKAFIAIGVFVAVMLLGAFNIVPLSVAVMIGVLAIFISGCITPAQSYRSVPWNAWLLIVCMIALGKALETTGLAALIANFLVGLLGDFNHLWLLGTFFALAMVLTQPMSNQAAAVVVVPIALQTAMMLGLNPRTFAVMIAVGASCSYITPLEPACLMVYGPGNYRFTDFIKVGLPLTVMIFILALALVPLLWPLY